MRRDALFAGAEQVRRKQPFMKRDVRTFVDSADCCSKWLLACPALVQASARALALKFRRLIKDSTMRANRTVWPADLLEMRSCGVLVVEDRVCKVYSQRAPLSCYLHSDFWSVRQVHNCRPANAAPAAEEADATATRHDH